MSRQSAGSYRRDASSQERRDKIMTSNLLLKDFFIKFDAFIIQLLNSLNFSNILNISGLVFVLI